jgi:probable lipoprotein NlpC
MDYSRYISVPFLEKGRNWSGCDCWGLVRLFYANEYKIDLPDYLEFYKTTQDREALADLICGEKAGWQEVTEPQEGDVIIVNMRGVPMHVGVVTRLGYMLHCARGVGTAHERYDGIKWRSKIVGYSRHPDLRSPRAVQQ